MGFILLLMCSIHAISQTGEVFTKDGKAIEGYDPVAFFTESKPVMGADSLSYKWNDTKWLFSSAKNREAFKENPKKYAPQYGGYCAYGIAQGHKAPTKIDTWTIVDNKLYLNYNASVNQAWVKDQKKLIDKADKEWPEIKDKK